MNLALEKHFSKRVDSSFFPVNWHTIHDGMNNRLTIHILFIPFFALMLLNCVV